MAYLRYQEPYKMRKISIFLMKVHRFNYLVLGALLAAFVFYMERDVGVMFPFSHNPLIPMFFIFSSLSLPIIGSAVLYTEDERKAEDIDFFQGFARWDNYFPVKINTQLSTVQRLFAHIYAISRAIVYVELGYICSVIVGFLIYKGV